MAIKNPIIILGNQKSGTTAIASLIADYGKLTKILDIPEIWTKERDLHAGTFSLQTFVQDYPHRFSANMIKEPTLTFLYEKVAPIFPCASYVFIIRHPVDNIRSILDRLRIPGNKNKIDYNDYDINESWSYVLNGRLLNISHEHYIARLAMRWVVAAKIYLKHENDMTLVRYEDFMENKYKSIEHVAEKLGVTKKNEIEHLLHFQYQPKGENRENSTFEFFGKENLALIYDVCGDYMKYFNYA